MENEMNHVMDDLLVKYLLEEAGPEEQEEVQKWLKESDANQKYFDHFELIWKQSGQLALRSTVDENAAWERFRGRVDKPLVVRPLFGIHIGRSLRFAALLLAAVGAGWLVYLFNFQEKSIRQLTIASGSATLTDTLPDGSVVYLNKQSSISYPERFSARDSRLVTLTGEAFFEVTPDKTKPFVISVKDIRVTVVGTSFNVKQVGNKTEVVVETGIVEVTRKQQMVRLRPNEKASVSSDNQGLVKQKSTDELYNYYRTKKFVCEGTPLPQLVELLNEVYQADIVIGNENLKTLEINTIFEEQPLEKILPIISETLNLTVTRNGKQIILK